MASAALSLALSLAACESRAPVEPGAVVATDPALAQFESADIANFWTAVDSGASTASFQRHYLNVASPGLRDFAARRSVTATSLSAMARAFPSYFASIRANTMEIARGGVPVQRMRQSFVTMKSLYPAAVFPTVSLLFGRFSTGGTASPDRIMIAVEFFSRSDNSPLTELPPFQRENSQLLDGLPVVLAHEHVHALQSRAGGFLTRNRQTLLEQALLEGSADFIGELVSDGNINARLRDYALPREAALWLEFRNMMNGYEVSAWLYNQGAVGAQRPGDLGYFIGYRIAEAFYARTADKQEAVRAIIEMQDATAFLLASGYAPSQ